MKTRQGKRRRKKRRRKDVSGALLRAWIPVLSASVLLSNPVQLVKRLRIYFVLFTSKLWIFCLLS